MNTVILYTYYKHGHAGVKQKMCGTKCHTNETKCHTKQSVTPHTQIWWESVGTTSWILHGCHLWNPTSLGVGMTRTSSVHQLFRPSTRCTLITKQWWYHEHVLFVHSLFHIMVSYVMFGWVLFEYGLQYELLVVWDTGREWQSDTD